MGGTRGPPHCSQEAPVALGEGASLAWGVCVCVMVEVLSSLPSCYLPGEGREGEGAVALQVGVEVQVLLTLGWGWGGWDESPCSVLGASDAGLAGGGWGVATVQQLHRTEVSAQHSAFAGRWGGPGGTMVVVFSCLPGVKQFLCKVFCPVVRESGLLLDISLAPVGVSEWTAYSSSGLGIAEASR